MKPPLKIKHEFVEFIPKIREEGVLYVSIPYATAVHNCFCGCRTKVVTPISPVGWELSFDGESVSLKPSVGNWSFPCRSHYVIKRDKAVWVGDMSDDEIARGRARDRSLREVHFDAKPAQILKPEQMPETKLKKKGLFVRPFGQKNKCPLSGTSDVGFSVRHERKAVIRAPFWPSVKWIMGGLALLTHPPLLAMGCGRANAHGQD